MTSDEAAMMVGVLVAGTTGWNDDTVMVYIDEMKQHRDTDAMANAVRHIVRTWSEARRPPISVILDAYRSELAKRQLARTAIGSTGRRISPAEGARLARDAYQRECERLGRKPDVTKFDKFIERFT